MRYKREKKAETGGAPDFLEELLTQFFSRIKMRPAAAKKEVDMKIALGCDHGGFALKQEVIRYLDGKGLEWEDFGCFDESSCDYPDYGRAAAEAVAAGKCDKGIVICTTGIGISIVANKVRGIRCALCADTVSARLTREHNDANMLAMGAGIIGKNLALSIVETFLDTPFSGEEKHARRVGKITDLEKEQ